MDFSIPPDLPLVLQTQLNELILDYKDENLTLKGYETKRKQLLERYLSNKNSMLTSKTSNASININKREHNFSIRVPISNNSGYGDDNASAVSHVWNSSSNRDSIKSIRQNSIYRVTTANSSSGVFSPKHKKSSSLQLSLQSNDANFDSYNPMMPLLPRIYDSKTSDSLPLILRGRYEHYEKVTAIISIDGKNKEASISWGKLYLRAAKIAYELNKSQLFKMDKVLVWYNKSEIIDFAVALLGCFIAGMVAIPVSFETYSLGEVIQIIKLTNSKFVLISNDCHKQLDNLQTTSHNTKIKLIKNDFFSQMTFLKTSDLGIYSKAKKEMPTFEIPIVSYIEFTRTPLGRLSGVVMKHKSLASQFKMLASILDSRSMPHWKKGNIIRLFEKRSTSERYTILNSLDPTRSTGLILGLLFNIFTGNLLISIDDAILKRPGGYEEIINQYKADILLNDQLQLKQVVINYLEDPKAIISKKQKVNFNCIKCCLTSCTTIDIDVSDMVVHKWLTNMGCLDATICYSPILTLSDVGGTFISLRDQLGKSENFPIHNTKLRLQDELFVNKEKLRGNIIEPSITAMINSSSSFTEYLRLTTFGFPIPDATLCIVNLDDCTLVPDLTVGEIWINSKSLTDEFYQLDRVNEFVFHAKLNFPKMFSYAKGNTISASQSNEKLNTIMNLCPPSTHFMRTKLMGFVHNGKLYVLSMIEDMFLQNRLVRLPNWAHTSDITRMKKSETSIINNGDQETTTDMKMYDSETKGPKRVVQTHYLQQVAETVVRTVNTVTEVSAFELNHNSGEHFLVMVVESSLVKKTVSDEEIVLAITPNQEEKMDKKMNEVIDQIYRILWIFHKIQPMCIMVVGRNTLPRRYCSLELANSTIEKKFISGELESQFVKFQFDNIILDFIPHSFYYNESIFSEHLSNLRQLALKESAMSNGLSNTKMIEQSSNVDYKETDYDSRYNTKLTDFKTILDILEWRIDVHGNESAFNDGCSKTTSSANDNNIHQNISWKAFGNITASFMKKIVSSKIPLKKGDRVVVMCENSVEYVAIVLACFYCNLIVIPLEIITENSAEEDVSFFCNILKNYSVKRIFIDAKTNTLLENNAIISRIWKKKKHLAPKFTIFSKVKARSDLTIKLFKKVATQKSVLKLGSNKSACVIWINRSRDVTKNIHPAMSQVSLLNSCKILKESFQASNESTLFSLCTHTNGMGFIISCLLGIYVGCYTNVFAMSDVSMNPKKFLVGLQNMNVRDLYLTVEALYMLLDRAVGLINYSKTPIPSSSKKNVKSSNAKLNFDFLRGVKNIMIPFLGSPEIMVMENILNKYTVVSELKNKLNFIYQNHFNCHISLRSYMGVPPNDLFLDRDALREGLVKEVDLSDVGNKNYLRIQDSGIVPICTDVKIVNPETRKPCLDGEFGEIWCCSEANASDYFISKDVNDPSTRDRLSKDPFITEQFRSKLNGIDNNGLTYLRTGDLGFIENISCLDSNGEMIDFNLLYVLGSINETIDILGLTYFVRDLETTVKGIHISIYNCIITKSGGLLVCLVKCKGISKKRYANLSTLITSQLLEKHGVILDLCAFVKPIQSTQYILDRWNNNRTTIMKQWFGQKLKIEAQFGINFGENISMYLLSDFEKDN